MPGIQDLILGLRGSYQAQEGPCRAREGSFESEVGEKRTVFIFGGGPLDRGVFMSNFNPVARGLAAPLEQIKGLLLQTRTLHD